MPAIKRRPKKKKNSGLYLVIQESKSAVPAPDPAAAATA
jgi:hypothetical protein